MKKILYIALFAFFPLVFTANVAYSNPYAVCRHARNPKRCYYNIKHHLEYRDRRDEHRAVKRIIRREDRRIDNREERRIQRRADEIHRRNKRERREEAGTAKTVKIINGVRYVQYYDRYGKLRTRIEK